MSAGAASTFVAARLVCSFLQLCWHLEPASRRCVKCQAVVSSARLYNPAMMTPLSVCCLVHNPCHDVAALPPQAIRP